MDNQQGGSLKELARAATPGPWKVVWSTEIVSQTDGPKIASCDKFPKKELDAMAKNDAAYIAAANPSAVLALIEERDALRAGLNLALDYLTPRITGTKGHGETVVLPAIRAALSPSHSQEQK